MIKKFLIAFIIFLLVGGGLGLYSALKYRTQIRQERQTAKAPDVTVTFLEGWNNQDIGNYLEKNGIAKSSDFLKSVKKFDVTAYPFLAGKPATAGLQGFLFPDTYFIPKNPPAGTDISDIIIKKALDNFGGKYTPEMAQQGKARNISIYEIITLASIIEKETGASFSDKKLVAGVFYNRLKAGMPLQSDATISYITGNAVIGPGDTNIDSSYNTYKNAGLPAGPICNPSLNSILAAIEPTDNNYFYFLTDPQTHRAVFATTYDQHLKNKQMYLK